MARPQIQEFASDLYECYGLYKPPMVGWLEIGACFGMKRIGSPH